MHAAVPWTVAPSPLTRRLSALQTFLLPVGKGEQIMVRGCALNSGSLIIDTEIVRITLQRFLLPVGEGEQIMVRGCALDSGSLTMDTDNVSITSIVSVCRRGGTDNGTGLCPGQWLPHHGYGECQHCICLQARGSR
jgi:hypothetical protein